MTLAELFIKIGFQIDQKALPAMQKGLKETESRAIKLSFAVDALVGAMTGLMYFSARAAVGLQKFGILTDVSTDAVQDWQYAAAKFNVAGGQVTDTIMGIQNAQAQIALGQGNIGPWQFLGINPNQDPLKVLWQVHLAIQKMRPDVARLMTSQMGITQDMFTFLKRSNLELGQLQAKFKLSTQDIDTLAELNGQFAQMKFRVQAVGEKLAVQLAPAFRNLFHEIEPFIQKAADWLVWLAGDSSSAHKKRQELVEIAEGFVKVGVAMTAIVGLLKGAGGIVSGMQLLMGLNVLASPFGIGILALAAAIYEINKYTEKEAAQNTARGVKTNGLFDSIANPQDAASQAFFHGGKSQKEWDAMTAASGKSYFGKSLVETIELLAHGLWNLNQQSAIYDTKIYVNGGDINAVTGAIQKTLNQHKKQTNSAVSDQTFPSAVPATH